MTDSLALYSLFATIDPTLNTANPADGIGKITRILESASADPAKSLELTLDALRTLFNTTLNTTGSLNTQHTTQRGQVLQNHICHLIYTHVAPPETCASRRPLPRHLAW